MRFSEKQLEQMVDEYLVEAISDFTKEVERLFLCSARSKYISYSTFTDEVLQGFFDRSDFKKLIKEDISYVMDRYPEYWARYIINEIDKVVDFKALKLMEEEKIRKKYSEDIHDLEVSLEILKNLIEYYSIEKKVQVKYVKHKKKFINFIGLKMSLNNSLKAVFDIFLPGLKNDYSHQLASSQLEKEVKELNMGFNNTFDEKDLKNKNSYQRKEYEVVGF